MTPPDPLSFFPFLTAAFGVVLGLSISTTLNGIGQILKARPRVRVYWVHLVWVAQVLLTVVQCFWSLLQNREVFVTLNFFEYLGFWLYPISLYLLTTLLFPKLDDDRDVDLRAHYYANHRWFFAIASLPPTLFLLFHFIYLELPATHLGNVFLVVFLGITATLAATARSRVHEVLTPAMPVLFVFVIALFRIQATATSGALAAP